MQTLTGCGQWHDEVNVRLMVGGTGAPSQGATVNTKVYSDATADNAQTNKLASAKRMFLPFKNGLKK